MSTHSIPPRSLKQWVRHLGPGLGLSALLPYIVYRVASPHCSILVALAFSAVPAALWTSLTFLRRHRVDPIGVGTLLFIGLSLALGFLGHNPRLVLMRGPVLSAILGTVCLVSLLFRRPAFYYIIRHFLEAGAGRASEQPACIPETGKSPILQSAPSHGSLGACLSGPAFIALTRVITLVWAITLLVAATAGAVLAIRLSIPAFLLIEPIVGHVCTAIAVLFTLFYGRHRFRTSAELQSLTVLFGDGTVS